LEDHGVDTSEEGRQQAVEKREESKGTETVFQI
jgi:hypothetical protein